MDLSNGHVSSVFSLEQKSNRLIYDDIPSLLGKTTKRFLNRNNTNSHLLFCGSLLRF